MRHELLCELATRGIELRLVPGLERTVWRPGTRILKIRAGLSAPETEKLIEGALAVDGQNPNLVQQSEGVSV